MLVRLLITRVLPVFAIYYVITEPGQAADMFRVTLAAGGTAGEGLASFLSAL